MITSYNKIDQIMIDVFPRFHYKVRLKAGILISILWVITSGEL